MAAGMKKDRKPEAQRRVWAVCGTIVNCLCDVVNIDVITEDGRCVGIFLLNRRPGRSAHKNHGTCQTM